MNTKHKHCELIKAWADGAEIEYFSPTSEKWVDVGISPAWSNNFQYRIKPEQKPDVVTYFYVSKDDISYTDESGANLIVIIDGLTNLPKSAEVLK